MQPGFFALAALTGMQFQLLEQVDPLDDTKSAYAVVGDARRHLAVGCENVTDPGTIRVVIRFDRYVGDARPGLLAGGTYVHYRFDQRPAVTVRWYSHDDTVTAESERTRPIKFILEMKHTSKVYLRAENYDGDRVDLAFTYGNPTKLIEDVLVRCGYSPDGSLAKE